MLDQNRLTQEQLDQIYTPEEVNQIMGGTRCDAAEQGGNNTTLYQLHQHLELGPTNTPGPEMKAQLQQDSAQENHS